MNFSSEYILDEGSESEAEDVEDDEYNMPSQTNMPEYSNFNQDNDGDTFECEAMIFDDEDGFPLPPSNEVPDSNARVNTNKVNLPLSVLADQPPEKLLEKSQEIICANRHTACGAYLSHLDKKEDIAGEGTAKLWTCLFCGHKQRVENWPDIDQNDVAYVDPPLNPVHNLADNEPQTIIFVLDISGSMCSSMPIRPLKLIGTLKELASEDQNDLLNDLLKMGLDMQDPNQRIANVPPINSVTRMQVVKAAVIDTIESMKPNDRAGLVVFNDKVKVYGDCLSTPLEVPGDQSLTELNTQRSQLSELKPIRDSKQNLLERVKGLKETGQTALGPALFMGIYMAMNVNKSKVFLCTDGLANIGQGSLPYGQESPGADVKKFYTDLIYECKHHGVSVHINSFNDCKTGMETLLGTVPVETGGKIGRSASEDPDLQEPMKKAFDTSIIATGADMKFIVHQKMFVENKSNQNEENSDQFMMGNVNKDMTKCYSFGFKTSESTAQSDNAAAAGSDPSQNDSLEYPFQFQVDYTTVDGRKVTRVWTNSKKVTRSRKAAEKSSDNNVSATNFVQDGAAKILDAPMGQYMRPAKEMLPKCEKFLKKNLYHDIYNKVFRFKTTCMEISRNNGIGDNNAVVLRTLQSGF